MNKELIDQLKASGMVHIERINAAGDVVETRDVKNLVVTVGKNYIASRMVGTASAVMSHMAIGTGTTAPAVSNTAPQTQTGRVSLSGNSASGNAITYTATFPAGTGTGAITEAAVLNASSGGTMLCRTTFPVVNKQAGDTIAVTWVVTVS